jgi:hypothetical protein
MKKSILLLILIFGLQSCKWSDKSTDDETVTKVEDSTSAVVVNDKDENGCLASAGYIWSKVNKECIKVFTGIQLNPITNLENEDETLGAYILFNEDGDQAELYLPNETSSIVLEQQIKGKSWEYDGWQLIKGDGYTLKKADKIIFSGDGEIGKKVTGSDTEQ